MNEPSNGSLPSVFDDGDAYDLVLSGITFGLDFYVALACEANGPVLDIACGTGRILLPCLEAGVDIEGLDLYEPMLKRLRTTAATLNVSPRLHQADMCDFSLPRSYGLVMIPFNAFIHNMTQQAQISCLERCREHLLPGGKLVFDTFFPSPEIVGAPPEHTCPRRGNSASANRLADAHVRHTHIRPRRADAAFAERARAAVRRWHRPVRSSLPDQLRYVYKHEMELLLRVAGFARWEICGDFDGRPLTREDELMVVTAWKA